MTREELIKRIRQNLENADRGMNLDDLEILVQRDPFDGWNVAVITSAFAELSPEQRKKYVLRDLDESDFGWIDLLTPEEKEWAGPLPGDIEPEDLPLWPEALGRTATNSTPSLLLPSDLDDDLDPPIVTTFYSHRGGVGRSTTLVYVARLLADNHRKVVCVDMDLEAPSLPVLLGCDREVQERQGVVEILFALDQGEEIDFPSCLVPVADADNLFVLPAGQVSARYARKLRFIDPTTWYREQRNPLRQMLRGLREDLPFVPDAILLDARTGISDMSGPLLFDLADLAVIVFFPHPQARHGTELLIHSLLNTLTWREREVPPKKLLPEVRFLVSPIPPSKSKEVVRRYKERALRWIGEWLQQFNETRERNGGMRLDPEDITHFISYREDIATSDRVNRESDIWRAYQPVADWIERFISSEGEIGAKSATAQLKSTILDELSFSSGMAELQANLIEDLVQTENVAKALSPDVPLILGRKGTGKTAIFRYLSEQEGARTVVVHAPAQLKRGRSWMLSPDGFRAIETVIQRKDLGWRHFWLFYLAIAIEHEALSFDDGENLSLLRPECMRGLTIVSELDVINGFRSISGDRHASLELRSWVHNIDKSLSDRVTLLWDGLDTGFGSDVDERARRVQSIGGLFGAWMDLGQELVNIRFKILLRDDIWRQVDFDNKSHLFGRSVRLRWPDQVSFFKVAIKQALKSRTFQSHESLKRFKGLQIEDWPDDALWAAWDILVGERMRGGQTAFTRNWVWKRLADGNDDHSPRHLLQLFHESVPWERQEHRRNPYTKAIIRPRALIQCFPRVSEEAVSALREEFAELGPVLDRLEKIGYSPFSSEMLDQHELIPLASESGLLSSYEEWDENVVRYKVPDLYLFGLGMKRKGPA